MNQPRLSLYLVDMKYIRNLVHADDHVMSVSPQVGKRCCDFTRLESVLARYKKSE